MSEIKANPEEGGDGTTIESLQKQIENLNKGIATYRDEAKRAVLDATEAKKEAQLAKEALIAATKAKETKDGDELEPLNPQDQKRLEAWAKNQGFATKEEIIAERQRIQGETLKTIEATAVDEFIKTYPQYEKEEEWEKLKTEFSQYKPPTTIAEYRRILNKIHKELYPSDDGAAKARAEIEIRRRLGLGGGSQRNASDGEMTVESLSEKYPKLSKQQIESRLAEINNLYPAKK